MTQEKTRQEFQQEKTHAEHLARLKSLRQTKEAAGPALRLKGVLLGEFGRCDDENLGRK